MAKPHTRIHVGASTFTVEAAFGDLSRKIDLRHATPRQLHTVASDICELHGIKATPKRLRSELTKRRHVLEPSVIAAVAHPALMEAM
jgi:hypothetical protein